MLETRATLLLRIRDPKDALAWQRLAQFLVADLRKPEEASAVVDRMIAALPKDDKK